MRTGPPTVLMRTAVSLALGQLDMSVSLGQ